MNTTYMVFLKTVWKIILLCVSEGGWVTWLYVVYLLLIDRQVDTSSWGFKPQYGVCVWHAGLPKSATWWPASAQMDDHELGKIYLTWPITNRALEFQISQIDRKRRRTSSSALGRRNFMIVFIRQGHFSALRNEIDAECFVAVLRCWRSSVTLFHRFGLSRSLESRTRSF